ncbi:hypothetical protein M9Y10_017160 [Tritrichomonas musculus]|uniref:FLYWCH-type domain-containing protein n=1 Tax=Tritrichomonas musculus TaxID=1915356 RepID=A0ABR2HVA2_9EUKA
MANISFIGDRFINIRTSSNNRIEYRCIEKKKEVIVNLESSYIQDAKLTTCDFKMVWSKVDDKWIVTTYNEHTCPPDRHNFENRKAKAAHFPSIFIDEAIRNLKTHYFTINEGISAFKTEFTQNVNQRTLRRRLERQLPIDCEASRIIEWQKIPEYLENNIQNGGLSKLAVNKNNEIIGIGITKHPLIYKQYIEGKENKLFNRFFNKNAGGELSTSSPVESINSLIAPYKDKEPIQIFNILELYGYEQCTKLMLLKNFTTPYYDSRMNQVTQKANKFFAINVP